MKIVFATNNAHKLSEVKAVLGDGYEIVTLKEVGITEDIPETEGGSLDFASSPLAWIIFHLSYSLKWIGAAVLVLLTMLLMFLNRRAIIRYQNAPADAKAENTEK